MRAVVLGLVCACLLASAQSASAQDVPAACSGALNTRAFNVGKMTGTSLLRQAWNAVNDCDRIEEFEDMVIPVLLRYSPGDAPTPYTQCRFLGLVQGMLDELDGLFTGCANQCFQEGQFAGELSALAYCELSIALGGLVTADQFLRGPVQVCGLSFELGCDSKFSTFATFYTNDLGERCEPFTEDADGCPGSGDGCFFEVFDQARENQCAYNPLDEDADENDAAGDEP